MTKPTGISYAFYFGIAAGTLGGSSGNHKPMGGYYAFRPTKPMLKAGQPFVAPEWRTEKDQEYRVLASDIACMDAYSWMFAHYPFRLSATPYQKRDYCNLSYIENGHIPGEMVTDYNYAMDDGSVRTLWGITAEDPRVTMMRKGGSWGWTWILPNPLNN